MIGTWRELLVNPNHTIRDVIASIDRGQQKLTLVVDEHNRLVGVVSDGDVRRALLRGATLDDLASTVMNDHPIVGTPTSLIEEVRTLMRKNRLSLVPIVDDQRCLVGVEFLEKGSLSAKYDNLVVLMAGGRGVRLLPLTEKIPKPLLKIGDQPILEIIVRQFADLGFHKFLISINYLGKMIQDHFGDGSRFGVELTYIEESSNLGTAGALGLMTERPAHPFIVINGDLLTKLKFDWMIEFHEQQEAQATVAVREYDLQVPYGVVSTNNGFVASIDEKPVHRFFVSGGVYVLNPEVLDLVEPNVALDMPQLLERVIARGDKVAAFPLREYWIDIGRHDDFQRAELEFTNVV